HRGRRVGEEAGEGGGGRRGGEGGALEGQPAGRAEIEVARAAGARRPGVAPQPAVGSGFEGEGFRQVQGLVLEVVREKGRLHAVAEILARIHAEADVAELV